MNHRSPDRSRWVAAEALLFLVLAGCGSEVRLVPVEGTVTLDGVPLAGAQVLFRPTQGRPAAGETDAEGRYRLAYTAERPGTLLGPHVVQITTVQESGDDTAANKAPRERVPARYNTRSELAVTVTAESPTHDFALQTR